jgi:hypothetical protein
MLAGGGGRGAASSSNDATMGQKLLLLVTSRLTIGGPLLVKQRLDLLIVPLHRQAAHDANISISAKLLGLGLKYGI